MATPSVSFRISRSAEDLAATVHALSQRLVRLEQRLAAMELQVDQSHQEDPQELASLENVERLLQDCRDLLDDGADLDVPSPQAPAALHDSSNDLNELDELDQPDPSATSSRDGYPSAA
jgi:hypothetical protein